MARRLRTPKPARTKRTVRLVVGNIYAVDWDDHFATDRTYSDSDYEPVPVRTYGKLVGATNKLLNFEFTRRTDEGTESYRHNIFGILKTCITTLYDLGPDPTRKP